MNRRLFLSTPLASLAPVGEGLGVPGRSTAGDFIRSYRAILVAPSEWMIVSDEPDGYLGIHAEPIRMSMERIR